jgi:hypothetical protein
MSDDLYGLDAPPSGPDREAVKGRLRPPAIFLIVVGALNLLAAVYFLGEGVLTAVSKTPAEVRQESIDFYKAVIQDPQMQKAMVDALEKQDPQAAYTQGLMGTVGGGIFWLIISLLTLIGAIRMMSLKSYGLAITGAIVAAIPCISPTGCCLLGEAAGIWALIVLMNNDVRAAFR